MSTAETSTRPTTPATPTEVFHALADSVPRLLLGDLSQLDRLAGLYAEQTHVVHPFAPFGVDVLRSRTDLRRHFAAAPEQVGDVDSWEAVDRVVHTTADPEVVVAEFRYVGQVRGRPLDIGGIFVLRVRDGEIVESRDYADHLGLARALGQLDQFTEGLLAAS